MEYTVINNEKDKRFEIHLDGHIAFEQYKLFDEGISYIHTEVPAELGSLHRKIRSGLCRRTSS
jgi:hypothetical protein